MPLAEIYAPKFKSLKANSLVPVKQCMSILKFFFLRFLLKRKKKVIIENYFNFKNNVRLGLFFRFEKIFDKPDVPDC